jgi:hypothetical protein
MKEATILVEHLVHLELAEIILNFLNIILVNLSRGRQRTMLYEIDGK